MKKLLTLLFVLLVAITSCKKPIYEITVMTSDEKAGSVTGGGDYEEGSKVNISAMANSGYQFRNWEESGVDVSSSSDYSFNATKNAFFVANFDQLCALGNYGTVNVFNDTGFPSPITVDVTWGNNLINDERSLGNGKTTTYHEVPAGEITIWGLAYGTWYYVDTQLDACEDFTFTWESTQKSTKNLQIKIEDSNGNIEYLKLNQKLKN